MSKDKVKSEPRGMRPCRMCGRSVAVERITTTVPGSSPVEVIVCPRCDRAPERTAA